MTPSEWEIVTLGLLARHASRWPTSAPDAEQAVRGFVAMAVSEWERTDMRRAEKIAEAAARKQVEIEELARLR